MYLRLPAVVSRYKPRARTWRVSWRHGRGLSAMIVGIEGNPCAMSSESSTYDYGPLRPPALPRTWRDHFSVWVTSPLDQAISTQLNERDEFPANAWGDPERVDIALRLCRVIEEACGWPNNHFLPSDPLYLALHRNVWGEGLDLMQYEYIWMKASEEFGIDEDYILPHFAAPAAHTVGDFVDAVMRLQRGEDIDARQPMRKVGDCRTWEGWTLVRNWLAENNLCLRRVRLDDKLSDVLPLSRRGYFEQYLTLRFGFVSARDRFWEGVTYFAFLLFFVSILVSPLVCLAIVCAVALPTWIGWLASTLLLGSALYVVYWFFANSICEWRSKGPGKRIDTFRDVVLSIHESDTKAAQSSPGS